MRPAEGTRTATVRWSVVGGERWEAWVAGDIIGTVTSTSDYARVYAVVFTTGGPHGSHSSLDNAKAQLEGWARWQHSGSPWTP